MTTQSNSLIGHEVDGYRIEALLGHGGMAQVYRGFDVQLQRHVALKVILPEERDNTDYEERFKKEARAVASLRHPGIVSVHRFGHQDNLYYMAMDYIDGPDLNWLLKEYRHSQEAMPYQTILKIASKVAEALDYAHRKGVIHRDIKPSNIMMDGEENAIITDFGLALMTSEGTLGSTFGSPHYIAPEQAVSSANVVPQSDLYALGVIIYEMLTGRVPFSEGTAMQIAMAHISEPPPALIAINPDINPAFEPVLNRILSKRPQERYESGSKFIQALRIAVRTAEKERKGSGYNTQSNKTLRKKIKAYQEQSHKSTRETGETQATVLQPVSSAEPGKRFSHILTWIGLILIAFIGAGLYVSDFDLSSFTLSTQTVPVADFVIEGTITEITSDTITIFDVMILLEEGLGQDIDAETGDTVRLAGQHRRGEQNEIILETLDYIDIILPGS